MEATAPPFGFKKAIRFFVGAAFLLEFEPSGTVRAWGANFYDQINVPADLSNVVAISAGTHHGLALKQDGTLAAWGANDYGIATVPDGLADVAAIAAGNTHNLALKR